MFNIEIIPNWHPILVHFTVALLSVSALLYFAGLVLKKPHFLLIARWNLWIGAAITVGTILAGLDAYNSIAHDGPLHKAMTEHKNWALATGSIFILLALWALFKHRGAKTVNPIFVFIIILASGLLSITGYLGAEVVYRHGGGVMRMPEVQGDGGHGSHSHGEGREHGSHDQDSDAEQPKEIENHGAMPGMEMPDTGSHHDQSSHPHGGVSKSDDGHGDHAH